MSDKPAEPSPSLDLGQQRKRAKELLRAQRSGEPAAAERIARHLPRLLGKPTPEGLAQRVSLSEAQLVVAREAGFPSWPRLKHALEARAEDLEERLASLIRAAVRGDEPRVRALLEANAELPRRSLHAACALGDAEAALARLASHPDLAGSSGGPLDWTPLLYLTCSALARVQPARVPARVEIARRLLELGANPAEFTRDATLVQGERTALSGAVVYARSPELLGLLLDAGGARTERLWNTAIVEHATVHDDSRCLERLLALGPPSWELRGALATAVERHDLRAVRLLLAAGADSNASGVWGRVGNSLHHGILAGCEREILAALLEKGADPMIGDRDGRSALRVARRTNHAVACELLAERGVTDTETDVDRLIAWAVGGDGKRPEVEDPSFARSDHQMIAWALRTKRIGAIPRLLALGLDPDVPDDDGATALGLAARDGLSDVIVSLLDAGASPDASDLDGRTPLEQALSVEDPKRREATVRRLLDAGADAARLPNPSGAKGSFEGELRARGAVEHDEREALFERAAEAVVSGDLETLRELLEDDPALIHARSPRSHRGTLLHYTGANGLEAHRQRTPPNAVEVMQTLLRAGAEPDALARTYGGGPAQTTMALLVSSTFPAEAGLQAELVRVLCAAGAEPDGIDGDGIPMATAIAFRSVQAVEALAGLARLDNALFAAAAGRLDLLEKEVEPGGRLRAGAGHCNVPWLHMSRDPIVAAQQALIAAAQCARLETVRWLTERGVDPGAGPVKEVSALHEAAFAGHVEIVRFLLEAGVDPARCDGLYGSTAIGWALEGKRQAVIECILRTHEPGYGDAVDLDLHEHVRRHLDRDPSLVNAPEGKGNVLRWTSKMGRLEMVRLLLERGADRALQDKLGRTALDLAREGGHTEVVRLLEAGAGL